MEDLEQAFVEYASSRTDEAGGTQDILRQCDCLDRLSESLGSFQLSWSYRTRSSNNTQDSLTFRSRSLPPADWSMILHDVVGTSGYHFGVLRSFPVERIEQGIVRSSYVVMDPTGRRSSQLLA
ncbi:hypothetical protein Tco_1135770 [Tanacetum coccineum]